MERLLQVVRRWAYRWRMELNLKKGKSEVVVMRRDREPEFLGRWRMGQEVYIYEVPVTRCLGAKFQRDGGREVMHEEKKRKIGGMVKKLSETRRVLGEKAAVEAWRVFSKTVMLEGGSVWLG